MNKMSVVKAFFLTVLMAVTSSAQTTEFTYQGKLIESGVAVNAPRDLRIRLINDSDGTQIGADQIIPNVAVSNGIFTVVLDFGAPAFTGEPRSLEIAVSLPGANAYTTLTPRQEITSTPYAVRSLNSVNADTAANSTQLGGVAASEYVQTTDARMSNERSPTAGSGYYVQNQDAAPQPSANFSIDGTGKANIFNATTHFSINGTRMISNPGFYNLFAGEGTGVTNTSGIGNSYFGAYAGNSSNGTNNSFFGAEAGRNTTGGNNSFYGSEAGDTGTGGFQNSFFGYASGKNTSSGQGNVFFGAYAGVNNTTGSENVIIGPWGNNITGNYNILISGGSRNTVGKYNTVLGYSANTGSTGQPGSGTDLEFATAIGSFAEVSTSNTIVLGKGVWNINGVSYPADTVKIPGSLEVEGSITTPGILNANVINSATKFNLQGGSVLSVGTIDDLYVGGESPANTGTGQTFVGRFAGYSNTSGMANSFFGNQAGRNNTTGGLNAFIGYRSGLANTTGSWNTFIGQAAGDHNTTGNSNSFFGQAAGTQNQSGSNITLLGANTVVTDGLSYATAVGSGVSVTTSNTVVLGRNSDTVRVPGVVISAGSVTAQGVYSTNGMTSNSLIPYSGNILTIGNSSSSRTNFNGRVGIGAGLTAPTVPLETVGRIRSYGVDSGFYFNSSSTGSGTDWSWSSDGASANLRYSNSSGGSSSALLSVDLLGHLGIAALGSGGSQNVCWNSSSGAFATCSSSIRYKFDIQDYQEGLSIVRRLRPVTFTWRSSGRHDLGFIAEEVTNAEPLLTFTNKDGQIEGVNYGQISTVLVNAIKEQQAQIEAQEKKIEQLTKLVCALAPVSDVCTPAPTDQK